jgi:surfeit locus 1 family protein
VIGFGILIGLGTWQLQRLDWKRELIARAQSQLSAPTAPLPAGDLAGLDFRRVSATGSYVHDAAFAFGFLAEGGRPGARLVTPFQLDDGRVLLVDRGWLPEDLLPPNLPPDLQPSGRRTVEGVARWRGEARRGWMTPADAPEHGRWYGWDVSAMAAALGLPLEPLVLVVERPEGPAGLLKAEPVTIDLPNDHLGYAITWYALALVLLAVYVGFSMSNPRLGRP